MDDVSAVDEEMGVAIVLGGAAVSTTAKVSPPSSPLSTVYCLLSTVYLSHLSHILCYVMLCYFFA